MDSVAIALTNKLFSATYREDGPSKRAAFLPPNLPVRKNAFREALLRELQVITATGVELGVDMDNFWQLYQTKEGIPQRPPAPVPTAPGATIPAPGDPLPLPAPAGAGGRRGRGAASRANRHLQRRLNRIDALRAELEAQRAARAATRVEPTPIVRAAHGETAEDQARREYQAAVATAPATGLDLTTGEYREVTANEYLLGIFSPEEAQRLSTLVPNYTKVTTLKLGDVFLIELPNQYIQHFADNYRMICPRKQTVMVAIEGFSPEPQIDLGTAYTAGQFHIRFLDPELAETVDDIAPNQYWFYENYNAKRGYHFVFSNSAKVSNSVRERADLVMAGIEDPVPYVRKGAEEPVQSM